MSIIKYGRSFEAVNGREWSLLDIELRAFHDGYTVESGGLGKAQHMTNLIREIWPAFIWEDAFGPYEWAHEQVAALCENQVVGFTSGASSSKSDIMAKWALLNWFSDPINTLCIVISTSAVDAKGRIWGTLVKDYRTARASKKSVGKLIESLSLIRLTEATDGIAASDNSSICLIAAGNEQKDDAIKRLEGRKAKRFFLMIDEGQDVSSSVTEVALWNCNANPEWHVTMACNANSRFGTEGIFFQPIEGWQSVNRTTHAWKIRVAGKIGTAVHFDSTSDTAPNMARFLAGKPELPFLRKAQDVLTARAFLGEANATFARQFIGFWPDKEGESNYIITDAELSAHQAYDTLGNGFAWQSAPNDFAGLDPSYSAGGDRFVMMWSQWGMTTTGVWVLYFKEAILIRPTPVKGETKDDAAVRECKRHADERGIPYRNIGTDASAGTAFTSILHRTWSPDIVAVSFGGAASEKAISVSDKRIAKDVYANRTSELAYVLKEFLVAGQVRGVRPDHAKELTNRQYEIVSGNKIKIEPKPEMKKRLGYSPDLADAGAICLDVIRERLKVQAGATGGTPAQAGDWRALARKNDMVTRAAQARRFSLAGF